MRKKITDYKFPEALKEMTPKELEFLAVEIREFLVENISKTGGHLASNLGIVELTLALHSSFDCPKDKIVWDVGHQAYVHKILTGRGQYFSTLRQMEGLSGFPKNFESPCDSFNTGHASNSISAIAGMAKARDLKGESNHTIAVIGDGSLTGGLAYEGLNNLGVSKSKAIVILNDNNMSIGESIGGLASHLSKLRVSKGYGGFKKKLSSSVTHIPFVGQNIRQGLSKARDSLKYILVDGIMFEELGFTYIGPIDGHDIVTLLENIKLAKQAERPVLLHVITKKGKGYRNAEKNPNVFHGISPFDPTTGMVKEETTGPSYSQIFGSKLTQLAKKNKHIVAVSAAMISGTGLDLFQASFPERTFDVGIAEAHGVTFAAGLATQGMQPVVCIYSTFLQRAYDQILIDVCLQNLPVVFAIDRAGSVGADGETHHGIFDISFLNHIPNLTIFAPSNSNELEDMLEYAISLKTPCAIRYPRGNNGSLSFHKTPVSQGPQVLRTGKDGEIWAVGNMVSIGEKVCNILSQDGINLGLIDTRIIKPLPTKPLSHHGSQVPLIITLEDNVRAGGFGQQVAATLVNHHTKVINFAWPNDFLEQGNNKQLFEKYGLSPEKLAERIRGLIEK